MPACACASPPANAAEPSAESMGLETGKQGPLLLQGTVVLCGWFGCEERHLAKYAAWWQEQGWQPLLLRAERMLDALTERAGFRIAHASWKRLSVAQAAVVQRGGSARILFHTFSMAGWAFYGGLLRDMAICGAPRIADVCGAVIDSAPQIAVSRHTMAAAVCAVLGGPRQLSDRSATFLALRGFFTAWVRWGGPRWRAIVALVEATLALQTFPQLYIYSAADLVVRCASIEAHMQDEKRRGRVARGLRFEDSPHCDHFRQHRTEYLAAISAFVREDLKVVPVRASAPASAPPAKAIAVDLAPNELAEQPVLLHAAAAPEVQAAGGKKDGQAHAAAPPADALQPVTPDRPETRAPRAAATEEP